MLTKLLLFNFSAMQIVAAMVLNIICAAAFCANMFGFTAAGIGIADNRRCLSYMTIEATTDTATAIPVM